MQISQKTLEPLRDKPDKLIEIILSQAAMIEQLRQRIVCLEEQLKIPNAGPAPFRVTQNKRKQNPKQPGGKKGHQASYREIPEQVDQVIQVPLTHCPVCSCTITKTKPIKQHIIELPEIKPRVLQLITYRGKCPGCKKQICSSHPMQVSKSSGASSTALGAKTVATAAFLRYQTGLTLRKTCGILKELLGVKITTGGLSQNMDRCARRLKSSYQDLAKKLPKCDVVYSDQTGWWLNNQRTSLWVMCNRDMTYYRIVENKTRKAFHQSIPADYKAVLVSDCLSVYDEATPIQHKCYAHHLRTITKALQEAGGSNAYLQHWCALLKNAIALKKEKKNIRTKDYEYQKKILEMAAKVLLEHRRENLLEENMRYRLDKQRDHLFVFLEHEQVEATNNLAQRQLCPAVRRRKLSCGNKTRQGADSFEVLGSLAATWQQQGISFFHRVVRSFSLISLIHAKHLLTRVHIA